MAALPVIPIVVEVFIALFKKSPKKALKFLWLTFVTVGALFSISNKLNIEMFGGLPYSKLQSYAFAFNSAVEFQMGEAVKKIHAVSKGNGTFILEQIKWREIYTGDSNNPMIDGEIGFVKTYDSKLERVIDVKRTWLKNEGRKPEYTHETNTFNNSYIEEGVVDVKTIVEYAVGAPGGVNNMFIKVEVIKGTTYHGNFNFKSEKIFGIVIYEDGKKIERHVIIGDKTFSDAASESKIIDILREYAKALVAEITKK